MTWWIIGSDHLALDKARTYRDRNDRLWEWSDLNGWCVNGIATFGGWRPQAGDYPFLPVG